MKIYLASPYSHEDRAVRMRRFHQASWVAGQLMQAGDVVYCPIAMTHPIQELSDLPRTWDFWRPQSFSFIAWADKMVVLQMEGTNESVGVNAEINEAMRLKKWIQFLEVDFSKYPAGRDKMLFLNRIFIEPRTIQI